MDMSFLAELFGAILLVLIVGILYEGLKTLREALAVHEANQNKKKNESVNGAAMKEETDGDPLLSEKTPATGMG